MKPQIGSTFINGGVLQVLSEELIRIVRSCVAVDADGANGQFGQPPCYAPKGWGKTLDDLSAAGHPGNWWALTTDNGERTGNPLIQKATDPCPGAYISETSLHLIGPGGKALERFNPFRYVDAATVPFLVICPELRRAVNSIIMGCRVVLRHNVTGVEIEAVCADGGNRNEMGEISLAALGRLGIPGSARGVGTNLRLLDISIYPGVPALVDGVKYPLQSSRA